MLTNLTNYTLVLGSNSPRRKELLQGIGLSFEVRPMPNLDESFPDALPFDEIPVYIARKKAEAYRGLLTADELLITADTIVWVDNRVLGKPADREEAIKMLQTLSGKSHQVITGVCLIAGEKEQSFAVSSTVCFAALSNEDICYYVDTYQPFDKAGAYGIQEWIGYVAVERIEGSFYNVMGLPIQRLYSELAKF